MKQTPQGHSPEAPKAAENANAQHRVQSDLKAYLDGELGGLSRWLTARHVAGCASCRDEMRRLEHLGRQVRQLDQAVPASHLRARILASLPAAPPANVRVASRSQPTYARSLAALSRRPLGVAMGLCALLLMVGAFALARYGRAGGAAGKPEFAVAQDVTSGPVAVNSTPNATLSGSVQEAAAASSRSATPVRTQPDPFASGTMAQAGGKAAGADTGAARHSTTSDGADAGDESAFQPAAGAQAAYTDPTSAAADRIAATIIPDKLREKRQAAGAAQASASIHPSSTTFSPAAKTTATAPMQVAVAVVDVSEASRQVQKWAEQAGAQVTVMSPKSFKTAAGLQSPGPASEMGRGAYDAHNGTSGSSAETASSLPVPQTAAVLRLRVPAQRAAGLQAYLSHMEKSAVPAARTRSDEINAVREPRTDAVVTRPYPMTAHVLEGEPVSSGKHSPTVTILVRLESETSTPRP